MRFGSNRCGARCLLFVCFTVILFAKRGTRSVSGKEDGVCISQGGHFPKFSLEGHAPRKSSKSAIDLTLCRFYRKKTCCDVVQTHAALVSLRRLATSGEATKECLEVWEVLECSICDPRVGVMPGPPLLCPSFCDSLFSSCSGAFFSTEPLTQVLTPCGPKDVLCAKAYEWAPNSSTFCQLAGFSVVVSTEDMLSLNEKACFDGKAKQGEAFNDVTDVNHRSSRKARHYTPMDTLKNWIANMNIAEQIMWATGGLVLTAGALHLRQRNLVTHKAAATLLRNKLLHEEARARRQTLYKLSASSPGMRKERRHQPKAG